MIETDSLIDFTSFEWDCSVRVNDWETEADKAPVGSNII